MSDPNTEIDTDIALLRAQIASLHTQRANLSSILLSHPSLPARLQHPTHRAANPSSRAQQHQPNTAAALARAAKQTRRNAENAYRACAGVTAFRVRDPDPCARDGGRVLGVRVEVAVRGAFVGSYSVLFQRVVGGDDNDEDEDEDGDEEEKKGKNGGTRLRVWRHTVPTCIPLEGLAARWLPLPSSSASEKADAKQRDAEPQQQHLIRFGKALRKELVSWHLRTAAIDALRRDVGVTTEQNGERKQSTRSDEQHHTTNPSFGTVLNAFVSDSSSTSSSSDEEDENEENTQHIKRPSRITHIDADAAGRELTIIWSDRRTGILRLTKDGCIERAVVRDARGIRDVGMGRRALGRIEGLGGRLVVG